MGDCSKPDFTLDGQRIEHSKHKHAAEVEETEEESYGLSEVSQQVGLSKVRSAAKVASTWVKLSSKPDHPVKLPCKKIPYKKCYPKEVEVCDEEEEECHSKPTPDCKDVPEKKCQDIPTRLCKDVPDKKCFKVPFNVCFEREGRSCKMVPVRKCATRTSESCTKMPVTTCEILPSQRYWTEGRAKCYKVPEEKCWQEPVQNCKKVPHEVCYTKVERVARKVCGAFHHGHGHKLH